MSVEERKALGKKERNNVTRIAHALWHVPSQGRDVVEILEKSNEGRMEELIPIRYGRMAQSAFAFFRGCAALMAHDLASTPTTSLRTQLCGQDVAHKVVGVGSVGTRCGIALLTASENDPLILQYKEARESVLEPFCGKSQYWTWL